MSVFQKEIALRVLKSKFFIWTITLPFVFAIILLIYFLSIKALIVFPNQNQFQFNVYTDSGIGGNSEIIHQSVTDSAIRIDFKLKNGIKSPYIGISIASKSGSDIQLGRYNRIRIKTSGLNFNNLGIAFYAHNPFSEKAKQSPEIPFYTSINISSTAKNYAISFNQLKVPDWWYELNNIKEGETKQPDIKNITNLNIANAYTPNTGEKQSLQIYAISFSRNNKTLEMWLLFLELGIVLIAFISLYAFKKVRSITKSVTINYKPVEHRSVDASKFDFIDFINRNFQDSQISLEFVSGETGVSQRKITNEIQNRFDCNFKSYINRLRINESKRLLLESDLNIGEIAFKVGFNNQSHFNRVFKSELRISPTEFRDKHKSR